MNKEIPVFYSRKPVVIAVALSLAYLVASYFLIGFKTDQLFLVAIFNTCFFLSAASRKFILGFSIFIVYWILFDYMKAIPNYQFNRVHISELYDTEKLFFGIPYQGKFITPNEYWLQNSSTLLDVLSGIFYLCWIPVPLAFAAYLFYKDKTLFLHFSLSFVLVNFLGFIIYYCYPAAPPWYYQLHGNAFLPHTPGNTANLHKFDDYFNSKIFHNIYDKSSNVFAAMPSLHSSYPLLVLYFGIRKKVGWVNILFALVAVGIWFAAIYTSHHYVLDVLAGIACAIIGIFIFQKIVLSSSRFNKFLNFYKSAI